jgi:membrane-anchored mycosin MYCP
VDNQVGYGIVDPVLALTADVDEGPRLPVPHLSQRVPRPIPAPAPDHAPRNVALMCTGLVVLVAAATVGAASLRRKRRVR